MAGLKGERSESFGALLRAHRKSRRVTGEELAEALKVTQGTVSKVENDKLVPDLDYLSKFAHILRLTREETEELMSKAGVVPEGATPASFLRFVPVDFLSVSWSERLQEASAAAEQRATTVQVFHPLYIPGLLQTESYARHVIRNAGVKSAKALARAVRVRLQRQEVLAVLV